MSTDTAILTREQLNLGNTLPKRNFIEKNDRHEIKVDEAASH